MSNCIRCGKQFDKYMTTTNPYCSTWCFIVDDQPLNVAVNDGDTECLQCGTWFYWDKGYGGAHCSINCLQNRKRGIPSIKDEDVAWEDMEEG